MAGRARGTARMSEEQEVAGFVLPESAIFESDSGEKHVWLIDDDGMTVRQSKVAIEELDALGVRVKGIEAGQWVVTAGVHYLDEGQQVRILENPATKVDLGSPENRTDTPESSSEETE